MRLIDSKTLKVEEFSRVGVPPYAILSHTWAEDEVSFQDMQGCDANKKAGYDKIKGCCDKAMADGFEYVWVDTCCIDKTSSSELSEAINSMYRWYQEAEVCFVYMSDVPSRADSRADPGARYSAFTRSRWFTRGWTLQELIAPSSLIFFSNDWQEIGTKSGLRTLISNVTGIHNNALQGNNLHLRNFSVAQRMSWASRRETTRVEDLAYCLMGIFSVNMPMLYGEGERAFIRLQEEIMKSSDDPTIFAWRGDSGGGGPLLAGSPFPFFRSKNIIRSTNPNSISFALTNQGLHLQLRSKNLNSQDSGFLGILDCHEVGKSDQLLGIYLVARMATFGEYRRSRSHQLGVISNSEQAVLERKSVYGMVNEDQIIRDKVLDYDQCLIRTTGLQDCGISMTEVYPSCLMHPNGRIASTVGLYDEVIGAIQFTVRDNENWAVVLKSTYVGKLFPTSVMTSVEDSNSRGIVEKLVSANIVTPFEDENLRDVVESFGVMAAKHKRTWKEEPDRIVWQLPLRKDWIIVCIRRQIVSGERLLVVDISHVELEC